MNIIDRTIGLINPKAGLKRHFYRDTLKQVHQANMSYQQLRPNTRNRGIETSAGSEEQEISSWDRKRIIATMRKQKRENSFFQGIVNRLTDNVCGPDGPMLQFATEDDNYNEEIEQWWKETSKNIEARGVLNFGEFIRICDMEQMSIGDIGVLKLDNGKIQGIESERISTPDDMRGDENIFEGVKIDFIGIPQKYYIGKRSNIIGQIIEHKPYDAKDLYLHMRPDRFDMVRGISELFANLENLYDFQEYLMIEKNGAKFSSLFGVKTKNIKTQDPEESILEQVAASRDNTTPAKSKVPKVEVGTLLNVELHGEEDVEFMDNNRPGPQFTPFVEIMSRLIGVGVGMPLELVLLDFKNASFSSVRGALNEARRTFLARRAVITKLASHIFDWRYDYAVKHGEFKEKYPRRYEWLYPGWGMINPTAEMAASNDAIQVGLSNLKIESAILNKGDWKANARQRKKEIEYMENNNIPIVIGKPGASILGLKTEKTTNTATQNNGTSQK